MLAQYFLGICNQSKSFSFYESTHYFIAKCRSFALIFSSNLPWWMWNTPFEQSSFRTICLLPFLNIFRDNWWRLWSNWFLSRKVKIYKKVKTNHSQESLLSERAYLKANLEKQFRTKYLWCLLWAWTVPRKSLGRFQSGKANELVASEIKEK